MNNNSNIYKATTAIYSKLLATNTNLIFYDNQKLKILDIPTHKIIAQQNIKGLPVLITPDGQKIIVHLSGRAGCELYDTKNLQLLENISCHMPTATSFDSRKLRGYYLKPKNNAIFYGTWSLCSGKLIKENQNITYNQQLLAQFEDQPEILQKLKVFDRSENNIAHITEDAENIMLLNRSEFDIYNVASQKKIFSLPTTLRYQCIANKFLAMLYTNKETNQHSINIYNINTGLELANINLDTKIKDFSVSHDGAMLFATTDHAITAKKIYLE